MIPSQSDYWNSEAGHVWAEETDHLDEMLRPLGMLAINALDLSPGMRVLDIGCGAGAVSRALAARGCSVTGVDISTPLLEVAIARAGGPQYLLADAGYDPLPGPFDAAVSRFGVMFFEEPVEAFAHMRSVMAPGGRIAFVCWGPFADNAWAHEPLQVAEPFLSRTPTPPDPSAPGPFAFSAPGRALSVLEAAGWKERTAIAWRGKYRVGDDIEDALAITLRVGPLGRQLRDDPDAVGAVKGALRTLLEARAAADGVTFDAMVWIVSAVA